MHPYKPLREETYPRDSDPVSHIPVCSATICTVSPADKWHIVLEPGKKVQTFFLGGFM